MKFERFKDFFIPKKFKTDSWEQYERAVVITFFSFCSSAWCLGFAVFYYFMGAFTSAGITFFIALIMLMTPIVLKITRSLPVTGNWIVSAGFILLVSNACMSGGLYAPPVKWFLLCPLVATLLVGIRSGIFWTFLMLFAVTAMFAAEQKGLVFPRQFHEGGYGIVYLVTVVGGILFTLLTAILYDWYIKRNLNQIRESRDELSREISLRVQTEEELRKNKERFQLAVNGSNDGLWDWNLKSGEVWLSPYLYEMLGYPDEMVLENKASWLEYVHSRDREALARAIEMLIRLHRPLDIEFRVKCATGLYKWFRCRGRAFRNVAGKPVRVCGAITDVSERKANEEELRKKTEELKRSNQELEQFGYVTSHDLREPLRKIAGFVRLLEQDCRGKLDKSAEDYMDYIVGGVKRMDALITDLLKYSRAGRAEINLEENDFSEMIRDAMNNLYQMIEETKAEVRWQNMPRIMVHRPLIVQLIQNLLENAIKYRTDETPRIQISVEASDSEWLFTFRDNGIGFDPKYSERIFVVFQRLHTQSEYPGTGIGLAVCKKIVERHHGRLWAISKPGKGATFYFTLPFGSLNARREDGLAA